MRCLGLFLGIAVSLAVSSCQAAAEIRACGTSSGKTPEERSITLVVYGDASTANRYFCVISDVVIPKITIDSSEFLNDSKVMLIDQNNVRLAQEVGLSANQETKILVTFSGLTGEGEFSGTIGIRGTNGKIGSGASFPIRLKLIAKPKVQLLPPTDSFHSTACSWDWECAVLHSMAGNEESGAVVVLNLSKSTVTLDTASASAIGATSSTVFNSGQLGVASSNKPIVTGGSFPIRIQLPAEAKPDKYVGALQVFVNGLADPITTSFTWTVRSGPVLPLVVLILGILAGRFVQLTNSPRAQMQQRLFRQLYALQYASSQLNDPDVKTFLYLQFADLTNQIDLADDTGMQVSAQLEVLRNSIELLLSIQSARRSIQSISDPNLRADLISSSANIAHLVISGDLTNAHQQLSVLQARIAQASGGVGGADSSVAQLLPKIAQAPAPPGRIERLLLLLSGGYMLKADKAYRILFPLTYFLLLICMIVFGYYSFYLKGGDTLGMGGYADYVPLFFWGFSADIAQRSLQMLPARNAIGG